jgi:hypothetical protein
MLSGSLRKPPISEREPDPAMTHGFRFEIT